MMQVDTDLRRWCLQLQVPQLSFSVEDLVIVPHTCLNDSQLIWKIAWWPFLRLEANWCFAIEDIIVCSRRDEYLRFQRGNTCQICYWDGWFDKLAACLSACSPLQRVMLQLACLCYLCSKASPDHNCQPSRCDYFGLMMKCLLYLHYLSAYR